MDKNWRFPVFGGLGAGVLSFLIGGIFKVSFPLILIRALIFAVLFGGLIFLIFFLVTKFLSELISPGETSEGEFSQNSSSFGIEQNGEMGVEYSEDADSAAEGMRGGEISGEDISIELGDEEESGENSFGDVQPEPSSDSDSDYSSSGSSPAFGANVEEFLGSDHDPEEIAKSIRTVLKRDEKGSG